MTSPTNGHGEEKRGPEHVPSTVPQPDPVTPGLSKALVREHAYRLFRDRLPYHPLTLEDWIMAEKDLVQRMQEEEAEEK